MLLEGRPASSFQPPTVPAVRPRKRRRTATEVLAGYFDSPHLSRDFFADMANTDETIRAVNAIVARNGPLLIDSHFGSLKTPQSHRHHHPHHHHHHQLHHHTNHTHNHHRSLIPPTTPMSHSTDPSSHAQNTIKYPMDRTSKLMGRIQDISHLLLSQYDSEFIKQTPFSSLDQQPPSPRINIQPDDIQNTALSPQISPAAEFPRRLLPEESESRRRSPSITITTEEVSERPHSRAEDATLVHSFPPQPRRRHTSFTASPPTPTRSITSLTSHTSSKWPHTPDNEIGPSFAEISGSYPDDYGEAYHDPTSNPDVAIVQQTSSSMPSPIVMSPPPSEPSHWMMTHIREMEMEMEGKGNGNGVGNGNGNGNVKRPGSVATDERPPLSPRGFSLDNILSPAPSASGSPRPPPADIEMGDVNVQSPSVPPPPPSPSPQVGIDVDMDMDMEMDMDIETDDDNDNTTPKTEIEIGAHSEAQPLDLEPEAGPEPESTPKSKSDPVFTPKPQPTTLKPEAIRMPFAATPEREMSVASDHQPLPKPRARRKSKAMKIVESDDETEGEREKERERDREVGRVRERGGERERERASQKGGGMKKLKELERQSHPHVHPRLTIKIRPLSSTGSMSTSATTSSLASSLSKSSLSAVTVAEVQEDREAAVGKENEKHKEESLVKMVIGDFLESSQSQSPLQLETQSPSETLPPLIPGKARKRKAPPARKGWKGWVEVEVDEHDRPVKGFSLDDLLVGERRTRSGKHFDG